MFAVRLIMFKDVSRFYLNIILFDFKEKEYSFYSQGFEFNMIKKKVVSITN